jgi:hypothetical protein
MLAMAVESWDTNQYAGESKSLDCEDSGFGGLTPIAAVSHAAKQANCGSELVRCSAQLFEAFVGWGAGSTVTEPFLKVRCPSPSL